MGAFDASLDGIRYRPLDMFSHPHVYKAQLEYERKKWREDHAPAEPGRGIDGRPLMRVKEAEKDA